MGTASYLWRPMEARRRDIAESSLKSLSPGVVESRQPQSESAGNFDGWVDARDSCGPPVAVIQFRACNRSGTVLNCGR